MIPAISQQAEPVVVRAGREARHGEPSGTIEAHLVGHRAASWLVASVSLGSLVVAASIWSVVVPGRWLALSITMVVVVFAVLMGRGHFRVRMTPDMTAQLPLIALSVASGATATMLLTALPLFGHPTPRHFVSLLGCLIVAAIAAQVIGIQVVRRLWMKGMLRSSALVYGSDALARELAVEIGLRRQYGVDVRGFLADSDTVDASLPAPVFDAGSSIAVAIARTGADRLIIGPGIAGRDDEAIRIARFAASEGLAVWVVPRLYEMGLGIDSMSPDRVRGYPLVRLQRSVHPQVSIRLKRVFDLATASAVLLAAMPVMLATAALIKLTSPGPVLFAQERVGQHGRPIVIRKFRSMRSSSNSDAEWTADDRVTWIGKWIRRLNVDELPQLWSVVVGDMSLVGPRPERPVFVAKFRHEIPDYDYRHRMAVGMTGLAQIEGLRGDTSIAERVKYDNLYVDQWSFRSDLKILTKTVVAVLRQRAYERKAVELEMALSREDPACLCCAPAESAVGDGDGARLGLGSGGAVEASAGESADAVFDVA